MSEGSEYAGRIYALKQLRKCEREMIFSKVDSARYDIDNFLNSNQGEEALGLLKQAKEQLDTLYGFLQEIP